MSRELPASAIPVSERMPVPHRSVLGYVTDASVAIHNHPAIIHNSGTNAAPIWWSGLPGHWIPLGQERWTVTHWEPLPIDKMSSERAEDPRASEARYVEGLQR